MLIKKPNRDKNCILHTDHDYSSNHLWISLLIIKYRDLSSDTFSNFTKKERSDSDIPYLAILLHYTLSVLVICKSNSKNSRRALFVCKYPQWCSPKVKINFRFKFSCLIIPFSTSLSFSHQKRMNFIIQVSVDNFCKTNSTSFLE